MNEFAAWWKNINIGVFFCLMSALIIGYINKPEFYGDIARQFDNARFGYFEGIDNE